MKNLTILVVIFLIAGFLVSGCTLTETAAERRRRINQITELQMKMLVEDWDYFWLVERNTRTTQWHTWVGI